MSIEDEFQQVRRARVEAGSPAVPEHLHGVTKMRITEVLRQIDRSSLEMVDVVFALLDDELPSSFKKAPKEARFCSGATTAQIGCHVGILQRGQGKLDREGRDYWLKPLWEIGAIEKVYFDSKSQTFLGGHPVAKSANSAYRLADSFVDILAAPSDAWPAKLQQWIAADATRDRLELQARMATQSTDAIGSKHQVLIRSVVSVYVPRFLTGFEVLYTDDADGDRITEEERERLFLVAGIVFEPGDPSPDVLLWHQGRRELWVVEAVTNDGEVDLHKVSQMNRVAVRAGIISVGFTTAYPTWAFAARRQGRHKNIPPETFIWIAEDPSRQLKVI